MIAVDYRELGEGIASAQRLLEAARSANVARERAVYESRALGVLRRTYRRAHLAPGGRA